MQMKMSELRCTDCEATQNYPRNLEFGAMDENNAGMDTI